MKISAYLAGPDVFLPDAHDHARHKVEIGARHGIAGRAPVGDAIPGVAGPPDAEAWLSIFRRCVAMMEACDVIIANLTPFRGPSADAGTLIEVGWFLGRGKPVFGYSNSARPFAERSRLQTAALPDLTPGLAVEGFGLPDNLMIPGTLLDGGGHPLVMPEDGRDHAFDALDIFERCVEVAAMRLRDR